MLMDVASSGKRQQLHHRHALPCPPLNTSLVVLGKAVLPDRKGRSLVTGGYYHSDEAALAAGCSSRSGNSAKNAVPPCGSVVKATLPLRYLSLRSFML